MQSFDMQRPRTKVVFRFLISKMTTRLGATPKGAADKANFPLAPILGPQFILCVVSQSLLRYHGVGSKAAIQTPRHPMFSTQGGGVEITFGSLPLCLLSHR